MKTQEFDRLHPDAIIIEEPVTILKLKPTIHIPLKKRDYLDIEKWANTYKPYKIAIEIIELKTNKGNNKLEYCINNARELQKLYKERTFLHRYYTGMVWQLQAQWDEAFRFERTLCVIDILTIDQVENKTEQPQINVEYEIIK